MIPPTPTPTYSFDTGTTQPISIGGSPADANIAVSSTHICLTARGAFGCYTKGGALVSPGPGFEARPYEVMDFFIKSGIAANPLPKGTFAKDGRVVFDRISKRFFMAFQSREEHPRMLIAVSKSEDPRDGWWTYADNVETAEVNGQDYMWMGINATHLLISNQMSKCTGKYGDASWDCSFVGTRHLMYRTKDLVAGKTYSRREWSHVNGNGAVPCVHNSYTTDAFWVRRDDPTHASVWADRNGKMTSKQVTIQPSTGAVDGKELGGGSVLYTNIRRGPQNAEYRDGKIVFVSNDGHTWSGQSASNNAVRLVRLDVSKYFDASPSVKVEIDRIFGRASADDPSGSIFDYGWPAVATNGKRDIVVGSVRSNSTIYPELRASVRLAGQPDISSSVSLQKSSSPLSHFHMAGACADPSTDGVYLAQQYGSSSPKWRIHVAKILGKVLPDVIVTKVQPPATIARGVPGKVTVTIMNQGDAPMPATEGGLYLSFSNVIQLLQPDIPEDPKLATFQVPALKPNQATDLEVPFTVPTAQKAGSYFVGAALYSDATEYSKFNNANPLLFGNHGNAAMVVA